MCFRLPFLESNCRANRFYGEAGRASVLLVNLVKKGGSQMEKKLKQFIKQKPKVLLMRRNFGTGEPKERDTHKKGIGNLKLIDKQ